MIDFPLAFASLFFTIVVAASFVQRVTGFGMVILMMIFFPLWFPFQAATAFSQALHLVLAATIFFQYRRHVTLTAVVRPLVLYFPLFFLLLSLSNLLQAEAFRPLLGITLIILSLYFILFPNSLTIKPTLANTFICVFFNALIDAFFGIGTPFIAIYFLSLSQSKEAYIGTLQAYCMFSMIYAVSVRYIDKQYTLDMAPHFLLGLLALNLGIVLGNKVMKHLTIHHLKKIVYLFIGVAGILSLLAS